MGSHDTSLPTYLSNYYVHIVEIMITSRFIVLTQRLASVVFKLFTKL